MNTHNRVYEEMAKIIFQLSSNTHYLFFFVSINFTNPDLNALL